MTRTSGRVLALDVGSRRIGVALGDTSVKIAQPLTTLTVDGTELVRLQAILLEHDIQGLVVGLPRNLSGEETQQSDAVRQFVKARLEAFDMPIIFQDESVTSVKAEEYLDTTKKHYDKSAIDSVAAGIIMQDYLEQHHG